jgi:DNA-binding response OmpR family regulator
MTAPPPDVARWAHQAVADLTDDQRALVAACAAALIASIAGAEAEPELPAEEAEEAHTIKLVNGSSRPLAPTLWRLFTALSDGERHTAAELYTALKLSRPNVNTLRTHVSRLRRQLRGSCYVIESRPNLGYRLVEAPRPRCYGD